MRARLRRPVIIVSPPRSGSTLLYNVLSASPDAWTIRGESHRVIEGIAGLSPHDRGWDSNRLTATDATARVVEELTGRFAERLAARAGRAPRPHDDPVLLEKTPKNALRVAFLAAAFPDARFVYLHREPAETISSMIEGWRSPPPLFKTYADLPGWTGLPWSFLLVPGWRDLIGRPIPEIAAIQWATAMEILVKDLADLDPGRWCVTDYHRLLADPAAEVRHLCDFLGWSYDRPLTAPLPLSGSQISAPAKDKWRRNRAELDTVLPLASAAATLAGSMLLARGSR